MSLIYYVYAYCRRADGTPYYIGKGCNGRAYKKHNRISTPNDKSFIVFMETNLTELGALALERRYIRWYRGGGHLVGGSSTPRGHPPVGCSSGPGSCWG